MKTGELTIAETREYLDNGDISAVKLAESFLDVISQKNEKINAYLEVFDDVIEQAERAQKMIDGGNAGALTGIPIAIKDNILVEGHVASAASKILENHHATYDATVTKKLKYAGAVLLGRTNMDEFAMGASTEHSAFGVTRNPLNLERVPGGSSGGSAAAVAMGGAIAGLGSDTAGSVRVPASFCGLVGLRPTYGAVSRHGLIALGSSLDVIGPITRTVEDAEVIFHVIHGVDPMDSTTVSGGVYEKRKTPEKFTVGVVRDLVEEKVVDERARVGFEEGLERLKDIGCTLKDVTIPHARYGVAAYYIILPAEASTNLARFDGIKYGLHKNGRDLLGDYLATRGAGFGTEPRRRIIIGTHVLSAGYHDAFYNKATAVRQRIREDFRSAFEKVDVIALPTTLSPPYKIGEKTEDPVQLYLEDLFTVPANHTGLPALTVPAGFVQEGGSKLPLGMQFYAPHMQEHLLFEVGKKFEAHNG